MVGPNEMDVSDDAIDAKRATTGRASYELGVRMGDIRPRDLKFVNRLAYRAESGGGQ